MHLLEKLAVVAFGCALASGNAVVAEPVTDANIVTALDISDSIDPHSMAIEIDGMAEAIRAPEVIRAIQGGRHGRIGFAIFAWRDGAYPELVSWTIIATEADAHAVA